MVEYKLFDGVNKGFMLSREPIAVDRATELKFKFVSAPAQSTAVFEDAEKRTMYRNLVDGECSIPATFLTSDISVSVVVFGDSTRKYDCEGVYVKGFNDKVIVCPNGLDIPAQIVDIYSKMQEMLDSIKTLSNGYIKLDEKLRKLLEGWDFD